VSNDTFQDFGYYTDPNTGYKKFGMIPTQQINNYNINTINYDNLGIRTSDPRNYSDYI
jgi:hypothetical protein